VARGQHMGGPEAERHITIADVLRRRADVGVAQWRREALERRGGCLTNVCDQSAGRPATRP
jgi:hypothetical protein